MSFYKKYSVIRTKDKEVLEEFASIEAAESFMIMMQSKGENVSVLTAEEDTPQTPDEFDIEGLDIEEPNVEFGSELDQFNEDVGFLDSEDDTPEIDKDEPDVTFD